MPGELAAKYMGENFRKAIRGKPTELLYEHGHRVLVFRYSLQPNDCDFSQNAEAGFSEC